MAFSILFNKDFYALNTGKKFGRAKSLLETLCLEDRIIDIKDNFNDFIFESINYDYSNKKLQEFINTSKLFLENEIKKNTN